MSQRVVWMSGATPFASHLVVVDPAVEDWRTLIAGLASDAKLVVLDPLRDGVQAIADAVAGLRDLEAIHVVSHGRPGEIDLGATRLSAASLDHYADALTRIGGALKDGGDILLYGCDVAADEAGRSFIEKLANITGADVAAATHPVGASALGGSFDLDVSIGAIAAAKPFAPQSLATFSGLLATPTVTINQAPSQFDPTNAGPIFFDVLFSESVTGFDGSDISFIGSTIGGTLVANVSGSGSIYTVSATGMNGAGTLVASIDAGAAENGTAEASAASTSFDNHVSFDNVIPTVTINQGASQGDPTNGAAVVFDVHFSEAVADFNDSDISLAGTTASGSLLVSVTGSDADYTVTITGMITDGDVVASIGAGAAHDAAGNTSSASTSTDNTVTFDTTAPTVTINQASGQGDPTNAGPIVFDVAFSEAVTDFDGSDVSLAASTVGGTLVANVTGSGQFYTVSVSGMSGTGAVIATIAAGTAHDAAGNASAASTSFDNTASFDNEAPTVTINQGPSQADPANGGPISFDVVFSEEVSGFDGSDISFAGSTVGGTLVASVTGSSQFYTVSVTGMTGTGTVVASVAADAAQDIAGNLSAASTSDDNTVAFDNEAPTVTIHQGASQSDPTNGAIVFDVAFSESVTDFNDSDISLAGSTSGGSLLVSVTGSGAAYTVTVSGMTSGGDVVASIGAGAAQDAAGNASTASTSIDNTVTFDTTAPAVTINQAEGQNDPSLGGPVVFDVAFSEAVVGFDGSDISFAGSTAGGTLVANVSGSGTSYTVSVSGMTTDGDVVAGVVASGAHDLAGNASAASTSIDNTVTFDNGVNDLPVLSGLGDTPAYTENGAAVALNTEGTATVSDSELNKSTSYAGATLTLARHGGANPDDVFSGATSALDLSHSNGSGENVSLDGGMTFIGTFSQPGDGAFSITFNSNATAAAVDTVMRQVAYANTNDNPPGSVQIDFTFSDGNGQPDGQDQGPGPTPGIATGSVTVTVTQVDDAPVLINVAPAAAYGIGTSGAVLSPALGVFDVDATPPSTLTGLAGATVKIASGFSAGDALFVNLTTSGGHFVTPDNQTTNISVQSNAGGTLVLAGQDTLAHYQTILDAISYKSTAVDPTNGGSDSHRTITWTVNDGALNSPAPNTDPDNLLNTTILHFDAPPALDLDASGAGAGFTTTFSENSAPIAIADSDVTILDPDTAAMASATIVLTNAQAGDSLSVAGALAGGISSSIDTSIAGKITLHLLNSATLADYQTALGQIRFSNSSEDPNATDRDITVVVSDGEADSNVAHATVHVVPVNDPPVVTGSVTLAPIDQNGSARLIAQADLLSNVTDDGPSLTATDLAISSGFGTLIDNHNGTWSYTPAANDPSSVAFSYQVTDGLAPPIADSATMDILGRQPHPLPLIALVGTSGNDSFTALPGNTSIDGGGGNDTITFNFRLVDATISFLGNRVIVDGPAGTGHTVLTGFETYVFTDGTANNNDGNPLVDDLYYYSTYHDVWNAHLDAEAHFSTFGWHEGRNPDAFFNTAIYLSANPDVKAAGVNPLTHYDIFGWKEGRDPSTLFDTDAYLKAYPDVAAAHVDPLAHFLQYGAQEGRTPFAPTSIIGPNGFDYVYYLQHNADVAAANVDPLLHFEMFGWKEGRNPNAVFDTNGYLANYPDVAAAHVNPLDHYHIFGWHEGRDPSVNFDTTSYLAAYPDIAAANIDPLKQFLQAGLAEGRLPFADGIWG